MDYIDNKIILKSVYGKVGQKYTIEPCKNPATGRYPDCVKYVDSKGDLILTDDERNSGKFFIGVNQPITFESGKTFDLSDPIQKAQWEAIEHAPIIAKSKDQRDGSGRLVLSREYGTKYSATELFVERPGFETSKKVSRRQKIHDAETYIFCDEGGADGRLKMARLLGKNLTNAPDADVKDFLLDIASKDPDRIINLYTGQDLELRVLFVDAKDKNVIYSKNNTYVYGEGIVLGGTVDTVIAWFRDPRNAKLRKAIMAETYPDMELVNEVAKAKLEKKD
jgi:hypothetical protein